MTASKFSLNNPAGIESPLQKAFHEFSSNWLISLPKILISQINLTKNCRILQQVTYLLMVCGERQDTDGHCLAINDHEPSSQLLVAIIFLATYNLAISNISEWKKNRFITQNHSESLFISFVGLCLSVIPGQQNSGETALCPKHNNI